MTHSTVLSKLLYYFHFLYQGKVSLFLHVVLVAIRTLHVVMGGALVCMLCRASPLRNEICDKAGHCIISIDSIMAS